MEPLDKRSSKLNNRFRDAPPVYKPDLNKRQNNNFCSLSQNKDSLDLNENDIRTELEIKDRFYTAPPVSYSEAAKEEFEISSPMPISKISIQPRLSQVGARTPADKIIDFRRTEQLYTSSSDILQDWRSKRKNDILRYKYHTESESVAEINTNQRKQDYYQQLTNKYLPHSKQEILTSNPITHSPPSNSFISQSPVIPAILPVSSPVYYPTNTQLNNANTWDCNENYGAAIPNYPEQPLAEENEGFSVERTSKTRDTDRNVMIAQEPVKTLASHSVQTLNMREVEIQTTPPVSPPTREHHPVREEMLDDSLWSVSSLSTEEESHSILKDDSVTDPIPTPEVKSGTDKVTVEPVNLMEQDELLKLLINKANFYEEHICNIDKLLKSIA